MKIMLTGGGTAGHFYPLIAIAEEVQALADERKLIEPTLYYMSNDPYDKKLLDEHSIIFKRAPAGKRRMYRSILNFFDIFKMAIGIVKATWTMFFIYPDVVVSKGGYASVPATVAAFLLRIPVIIHESDSVPGRANLNAARFAKRIAVSWPEAAAYFPADKVAVTGQPVRKDIMTPIHQGGHEYLKLDEHLPVVVVIGGSQGARTINDAVLDILPQLITMSQVIHQTGETNYASVSSVASLVLDKSEHKERYKPMAYLHPLTMRMAAGVASLVLSRAGSGLFEIAAWGVPAIVIPISESQGDHQRKNAFNYARSGAAIVISEENLTPHLLMSEIRRILDNETMRLQMAAAAKAFFTPDAARSIAHEAIAIALRHEA